MINVKPSSVGRKTENCVEMGIDNWIY